MGSDERSRLCLWEARTNPFPRFPAGLTALTVLGRVITVQFPHDPTPSMTLAEVSEVLQVDLRSTSQTCGRCGQVFPDQSLGVVGGKATAVSRWPRILDYSLGKSRSIPS